MIIITMIMKSPMTIHPGRKSKWLLKITEIISILANTRLQIFLPHLDTLPESNQKMIMGIPNSVNLLDLLPKVQVSSFF